MLTLMGVLAWVVVLEENKLSVGDRVLMNRSDSVELYSIDPNDFVAPNPREASKVPTKNSHEKSLGADESNADERFRGYKVVRKKRVKDEEDILRITTSIEDAMVGDIFPAKCFIPHHGLRFARKGEVVDFVISFECEQFQLYRQDTRSLFLIRDVPKKALDNMLRNN